MDGGFKSLFSPFWSASVMMDRVVKCAAVSDMRKNDPCPPLKSPDISPWQSTQSGPHAHNSFELGERKKNKSNQKSKIKLIDGS